MLRVPTLKDESCDDIICWLTCWLFGAGVASIMGHQFWTTKDCWLLLLCLVTGRPAVYR